jgi:hypothetical protein
VKEYFVVNELNRKTISTLLSWHLYIIWPRINTELQLGKVCGQCWWLHGVEDIQEYR